MLTFNLQIDDTLLQALLVSFITLISLHFLIKWLYKPSSVNKLPPSPPKLPILGNLHQLSPLTHRSFQSLAKKYGPVTLLHLGSRPFLIVQSADAAKEIMKTNDLMFATKPQSSTTRRLFYDNKNISVSPYGEYWRKLKSICILQLLSYKRVQNFHSVRVEETELMMEKIKSLSPSPVNLSEMFRSIANDVICRAAFGRKYGHEGEDGKRLAMLIEEVFRLLGRFSVGEYIPCLSWINRFNGFDRRVDEVARGVDEFLEKVVQEHENDSVVDGKSTGENFVDILINVYKDNTSGLSIHRDSIKAVLLDVLAGGTDTTSATLEWAMTELLKHPGVLNTLQTEVREIVKDNQKITDDDLEKMCYLKAVVKETLRYHTPIPFLAREPKGDFQIMGYDLPAGTMIITNAWAIGRDPSSWDEPERFRPERFLSSSIDYKGLDFELIPFGSGRRGCPGTAFAIASVELVLANLVHKFDWGLPQETKSEDLDTMEQPGITIHRKNSLYAVATHCYF